jgi:MarC family membrane protein
MAILDFDFVQSSIRECERKRTSRLPGPACLAGSSFRRAGAGNAAQGAIVATALRGSGFANAVENSMSTLSAGLLLFLIMDPLGNVPLFLSLLRNVEPKRRQLVLARELLIALVVLFVFLFGGQYLLRVLQLKQESVSIAGGIVLFLIGVRMVFPPKEGIFGGDPTREPLIVPMAIPGIAGPSAVAAVMLLANSHPGRAVDWSVALFLAWLATAVILLSSTYLFRYLGTSVLIAVERLMGMLLVALSVQMFLDGIVAYVKFAL